MKITTIIPAYKAKYLHDLLIALYHQTVRPERVIFSDDSPDRAFHAELQSDALKAATAGMNIEVVDGPRAGAFANCRHLLKVWNGSTPLAHLLLDDDVIYPDFYERHLAVHAMGGVDCTVSRRWTAVESGQPVGRLPVPEQVRLHGERAFLLAPEFLFSTTIPTCNNWLGELSNAVFNHDTAALLDDPRLAGISFEGLGDIGLFLSASLKKPVGFLNEPLGYFRLSPSQNSQVRSTRDFKQGRLAWIALGLAALRLNKLGRDQASQCFGTSAGLIMNDYAGVEDMAAFCDLLPGLVRCEPAACERFVEIWHAFLASR
ncbi:glycosyltransferase family 2 protein [Trinickia sp. EG282A]|uniref:glycosyltransferase family 2 protein n=1 Tax=Trinickia sp. EG282A TaxID=3237013 RepID=UPI0034D1877B